MKFETIPTWPEWQKASSSFLQVRANKPKLARIDELIKKYHQVLDMSKLNILMELKTAILDWAADKIDRDATTGRLEAMQALLDIVVRKLYELDGWGKHRYIQAVCIGYVIKTGDYDPNLKPANDQQRQKDETVDVGQACNQLRRAIAAAQTAYRAYSNNLISADEDKKTLKIFMAPEFFFRGRYGAYRDIGWTAKILSMMRTETGKPEYSDWLFVLGTAIFSTEEAPGKGGGRMLENYALVQKGGPKTSDLNDFVVAKEFPSHVDFKHPGVSNVNWYDPKTSMAKTAGQISKNIMPEGGRKDPIYTPLDHTKAPVSELVGGVIFTMDGITFGLEVCRDHYLQRLAHSQEKGRVLIQLIPSCGMSIENASIGCVEKGIVFNVDGSTPHAQMKVNWGGANLATNPASTTNAAGGQIVVLPSRRIPWPGLVRDDVAQRLNMTTRVLSGTAPVPPPKPPNLGRR
jgi:hypothetical protein